MELIVKQDGLAKFLIDDNICLGGDVKAQV